MKAFGHHLTSTTHMLIVKCAPEAVVNYRVDERAVAQPITLARFRHQIWRVRHRFHAARHHDLRVAQLHSLSGHHDRFQSRTAHFVYGHGRHRVWQSAKERSLSRRILAQPGLNYAAHDYFIDSLRTDTSALDRLTHHDGAKLCRFEALSGAEKLSHRRAHGTNDYCF